MIAVVSARVTLGWILYLLTSADCVVVECISFLELFPSELKIHRMMCRRRRSEGT